MTRTSKKTRPAPYIEDEMSRYRRNMHLYPSSILKHSDGWLVKWRNEDGDKCDELCATEAEAREYARGVDRRLTKISEAYQRLHEERLRGEW
jgi:hypothetical protein